MRSDIDGGGWQLVRHVPSGGAWHRATDHLSGTAVYGKPCGGVCDKEWSVRFDNIPFNQFMFAAGDDSKWIIIGRTQVQGNSYTDRLVYKSSLNQLAHKVEINVQCRGIRIQIVWCVNHL